VECPEHGIDGLHVIGLPLEGQQVFLNLRCQIQRFNNKIF
jgi:hypothetical protein